MTVPMPVRARESAVAPLVHASRGQRLLTLIVTSDLALALLYLLTTGLGDAPWIVRHQFDLDAEGNLTVFIASAKWLVCALAIGVPIPDLRRDVERSERALRCLLCAVFVLMAADEVAQMHEWFGTVLDRVVMHRSDTAFAVTHYWMVLPAIGIGLVASVAFSRMRWLSPDGARWVTLGLLVLVAGGAGVEMLSNVTAGVPHLGMWQVVAEETLENLGASFVLVGVLRYNQDRGVVLLASQRLVPR